MDIRDAADDFYSGLRVKSGIKEDICIEDQRDGREFWGDGNELDVYNTLCDLRCRASEHFNGCVDDDMKLKICWL